MKLSHRIIPCLLAIPALLGFWACSNSQNESNDRKEITELKNQLKEELSTISSDSLSSKTVWVAPEVTVVEDRFMSEDSWPFIVGIIGIVCGCAVPIGIVAVIMSSMNTRRRYEMRALETAINHNYPLPQQFYRIKTLHQLLYRAVVWIGVGIGCWYCAVVTDNWDMSWIGVFPLFIGLANLALYLVRRHDSRKDEDAQPCAPAANPYSEILTPSATDRTDSHNTDSDNAQQA